MSTESRVDYLWKQIATHLRLFFDEEAIRVTSRQRIVFRPLSELINIRRPVIVIPTDIPYAIENPEPYQVPFNNTQFTLWNRLPKPSSDEWQAIPNEASPLWYRHESGTLLPAWNLFGNLFALLTHEEERFLTERDSHDRFVGTMSPRMSAGLVTVPAFNEAVAALVGAACGLERSGHALLHIEGRVRRPIVVLSHDCDILRGNDIWTQSIRALRIFLPLMRMKLPAVKNMWWIVRNSMFPREYYFDNILGMINLERQFGFTSTFYILNGSSGRFGARSGSRLLPVLFASIPAAWTIGMHYNYDTYLNDESFIAQKQEIESLCGKRVVSGRAHYLRYDADKSPTFLSAHNIQCDESAGFSDRIGYRCGIAGCFQYYEIASESPIPIWEMPMIIMEDTLQNQFGDRAVAEFERLLGHLGKIGGALSVNVHPGVFHNPEHRSTLGLYHKLLCSCRDLRAEGISAEELVRRAESSVIATGNH